MTVVLYAQGREWFVFGGDGRRTSADSPPVLLADDAEKVRRHKLAGQEFITASSGRATIGGKPLSLVESECFGMLDSGMVDPARLVEAIGNYLREYNSAQSCDCALNLDQCTYAPTCYNCGDEHSCSRCLSCPLETYWIEPGENGCLCSPGEDLPSSTTSRFPYECRCKPTREPPIDWICAPTDFEKSAVRARISNDYSPMINVSKLTESIVLLGELATRIPTNPTAVSLTSRNVRNASAIPLLSLEKALLLVSSVLETAYSEAADAAVARLYNTGDVNLEQDVFGDEKTELLFSEVAAAIRSYFRARGHEADRIAGVPSIGGQSIIMTAGRQGVQVLKSAHNHLP